MMEGKHHAADDGTEPVPPLDVHESPVPTAILNSTQTIWQSIGAVLLTLLAFWAITQDEQDGSQAGHE
jgi:hypothetical protein